MTRCRPSAIHLCSLTHMNGPEISPAMLRYMVCLVRRSKQDSKVQPWPELPVVS